MLCILPTYLAHARGGESRLAHLVGERGNARGLLCRATRPLATRGSPVSEVAFPRADALTHWRAKSPRHVAETKQSRASLRATEGEQRGGGTNFPESDARAPRTRVAKLHSRDSCQRPLMDARNRSGLTVAPEGLEPSRPCGLRILNPLRLPFRQEAMSRP